jgi:Beta protein
MLENLFYCPILHARVAETKALFQLPAATKDRIFPLIVARPWPNANRLQRTWDKISEAFGSRRFALDLDLTRRNSGSSKPAAVEFDRLFSSRNGFANYYDAVAAVAQAIPVLRVSGGGVPEFDEQAGHVIDMDRGLVVRIAYGATTNPLPLVDQVLARFDDVTIFIDAGWSPDLLSREIWASGIIGRVTAARPEVEIVVNGSSFPDSFVDIEGRGEIPVRERYLYSNLVRRHNSAILVYGDWGSTRPPSDPVPMKNIPRIDLPESIEWISFRRDRELDGDEDYADIARRVIADPAWPGHLNIWGTYIIKCTANALPGAIRSPAVAASARINIHLHRQAFFGDAGIAGDEDEPFTDD